MSNTTNVFLPVELKQRNDNPRAHRVGESPLMRLRLDDFKQTFSVNPNDVEFFDVVGLDERSDVSELTICYARAPYDVPNTIPRGYYVLTVKAFGNVGHDTEIKLAISVEDGILRFNRL